MISEFIPALKMFLTMTLLLGVAYPILITGVGQALFKEKVNGSLLYQEGKVIGSELIGQEFKEARYFHSRPSAVGYNPMPSGGSNAGPTSADLLKAIQERKAQGATGDLLFASGSGLDPHISFDTALAQVSRVAHENGLDETSVNALVRKHKEERTLGFLGEPRVNVLKLNLDLIEIAAKKR